MSHKESIAPLALGAAFALVTHLTGAAVYVALHDEEASEPPKHASREPVVPPAPTDPPPPPPPEKKEETPVGQREPSPLSINWISAEAHNELRAERSKVDQAAVQRDVDPVPQAPTPPDPTTPMPRPSPAPVAASAKPAPTKVAQAASAEPIPVAQPAEPKRAPALADLPATVAAAPAEAEPTPPTRIEPRGEDAPAPQPATDDTPSPKPVASPKVESTPAETVALATPFVPPSPAPEPKLPEPAEAEPTDLAKRRAPQIKPDDRSDPDDKSREQPGEMAQAVRVAALPLPARVEELLGSPQNKPREEPAKDREETALVQRKEAQDPQRPAVVARLDPTPPRPPAADTRPRPTTAIRDDREAPPATREESPEVEVGKVLVRQGMEVRTARPRWRIQALLTRPASPSVEVAFDRDGNCVNARIVKSTGYPNVDGPLLTSLYRWTAQGPQIEQLDEREYFTMEVRILWPEGP